MGKDTPVAIMTIIFMVLMAGIMVLGLVENAKHPISKQANKNVADIVYPTYSGEQS